MSEEKRFSDKEIVGLRVWSLMFYGAAFALFCAADWRIGFAWLFWRLGNRIYITTNPQK